MARGLFAGALGAEKFDDLVAARLAFGAGVFIEPEFASPSEEALFRELGAEELWEDSMPGEDIHNAVVGEVDADNLARDEEVEWGDGKVDDGGDAVEGELKCNGAGGGEGDAAAAHEWMGVGGGDKLDRKVAGNGTEKGLVGGGGDGDGEGEGWIGGEEALGGLDL